MAVIDELIREEETGALSFGNFALATKTKKDGFQYQGDSYKIKTFREITKLEEMECLYMNPYLVQLYMTSARQIRQ